MGDSPVGESPMRIPERAGPCTVDVPNVPNVPHVPNVPNANGVPCQHRSTIFPALADRSEGAAPSENRVAKHIGFVCVFFPQLGLAPKGVLTGFKSNGWLVQGAVQPGFLKESSPPGFLVQIQN